MTVTIIVAAAVVAALVAAGATAAIAARRGGRRPAPAVEPWSWEGIRLEVGEHEPAIAGAAGGARPRLVIRGAYMARPSIYRAAESDWAFAHTPTPILVLFDASRGVELRRASLDRIEAEHRADVQGLSISYATPPPPPPVPDDDTRRDGAPFAVDVGGYVEPRDEPWELRVHAELGPLRSDPVTVVVAPARPAPEPS